MTESQEYSLDQEATPSCIITRRASQLLAFCVLHAMNEFQWSPSQDALTSCAHNLDFFAKSSLIKVSQAS